MFARAPRANGSDDMSDPYSDCHTRRHRCWRLACVSRSCAFDQPCGASRVTGRRAVRRVRRRAVEVELVGQFDKDGDGRLEPRRTRRRAGPRRRWTCSSADAAAGSASAAPRDSGRRLTPADVRRIRQRPALRPRHAAHDLPPVRGRRLGKRARRVLQHRRRGAGDDDRGRQALQGRRRPLPRRIVVLHGA